MYCTGDFQSCSSVNGCRIIVTLFAVFHSTSTSPSGASDAVGCNENLPSALSLLQRRASKLLSDKVHVTPNDLIRYDHPSWLESCRSIYLDVGSNIGVQVRKLFEPGLYPDAAVLPLFAEQFGPPEKRCGPARDTGLCALGFEPNPLWHSRLMSLAMAYEDKGWRVHFYPFAAGYEDSTVNFTVDAEHQNMDWGATVADLKEGHLRAKVNVTAMSLDFGRFLKSLPLHTIRLMKLDIEGSEWNVVASMAAHGVLCAEHIQEAFIEVHDSGNTVHWKGNTSYDAMQSFLENQKCLKGHVKLRQVDDESFNLDQRVLPWEMSACDAQAIGRSNDT
mmetsp:Transcript_143423/g.248243  ORF Transcript_143423/g.248243 Transcript_143423/m.248243 type:complete len:333 (+) Transcript_143423:98-1096(+)